MVDDERLLAMLARVTERIRILEQYAALEPEVVLRDRRSMGDLKYTFQTALEACIDAAQHAVASEGLGVPASNADAFRSMADADLLDGELADSMAGAAGFRNVLVHGYTEVEDARVVANLSRLDDLRAYVRAVTGLLDVDDRDAKN